MHDDVHGITVCAYAMKGDHLCVMRQYNTSFTLVIARKLDQLSCIPASVDSLSRWLALITSLQPALSLIR